MLGRRFESCQVGVAGSDLLTTYSPTHSPKKKEAKNFDLHLRKSLAEVHGNRTHLPPYSEGTPDLKNSWLGGKARKCAWLKDSVCTAYHDLRPFHLPPTHQATHRKGGVKIFCQPYKFSAGGSKPGEWVPYPPLHNLLTSSLSQMPFSHLPKLPILLNP